MGEYELSYEFESASKKINRLTDEYLRQVTRILRESMERAYEAGYDAGLNDAP